MTKDEAQIERIMTALKCSLDEAKDILEKDKIIDRGGRVEFDLPIEQEKEAKKMANATQRKKPTVYKFSQRERKADTTKEGVIQAVYDFLVESGYQNCEVTNKSKLIVFSIGDDNYEFNLIRKRKK